MEQKGKKTASWRRTVLAAALALALTALGLCWPVILNGYAAQVEQYYSETVYQAIRRTISRVTSLVPFSVAEILFYALALLAVGLVLIRLVQWAVRKIGFHKLLKSVVSLALAAGIIINLFYVTWGFNYFREPLSERMGLCVEQRSTDELEAFVLDTAAEAKALRETLHEDADGVFAPEGSLQSVLNGLPQAYESLSEAYPVLRGDVTRAKTVFWSRSLSEQGISGVFVGLTAEPNVNADQPPLLLYHAALHEMAHQTGLASENEADFVACLASAYSDDANVRYSGLIYALIVSGNALNKADPGAYTAAAETYGDAIRRDLSGYSAYWDAFDEQTQQNADSRNDAYLKHNAQESGILSYGESADLLLAFVARYGYIWDGMEM
jgi:hypothetical protein